MKNFIGGADVKLVGLETFDDPLSALSDFSTTAQKMVISSDSSASHI